MALRQLRAAPRSKSLLPRFYSSNVPAKAAPVGMMAKPVPSSSIDNLQLPIGKAYKSQGTAIGRTIRNIWKAGWRRAFWQIKEMNDTKVGTLVGVDNLGNKYYEDMGELPLRERWVEYKVPHEYDSTQIEPGWHSWMTYMTNEPPTMDPSLKVGSTNPKWEKAWNGTATLSEGAYRPYSTVKLKYQSANETLRPKARE